MSSIAGSLPMINHPTQNARQVRVNYPPWMLILWFLVFWVHKRCVLCVCPSQTPRDVFGLHKASCWSGWCLIVVGIYIIYLHIIYMYMFFASNRRRREEQNMMFDNLSYMQGILVYFCNWYGIVYFCHQKHIGYCKVKAFFCQMWIVSWIFLDLLLFRRNICIERLVQQHETCWCDVVH